ncbi:MAG: IMP cyclohydrolase [Dehalococcoidales bacterium]
MANPNGPYPGRQLFVGLTAAGNPALAYFVSGRSPASRERKATRRENAIIMGPLGDAPYDPLRHYTAVAYDEASGILVVTNGIQTQAILETYKLLYNVESEPDPAYLKMIMEGAAYEPDSLHTPRIAAVITGRKEQPDCVQIVSVITDSGVALARQVETRNGMLTGVSTYNGDMETPQPFDIAAELPELPVEGKTAAELADYLYGISEATNNGEDIRVCAIGGVLDKENHTWDLSIVNRHQN